MKTLYLIPVLIFLFVIVSYKNPEKRLRNTIPGDDKIYVHTTVAAISPVTRYGSKLIICMVTT